MSIILQPPAESAVTDADMRRRVRLGEDSTLEFKGVLLSGGRVKDPDRNATADELAALANSRGGTLILGVDDKTHRVQGIPLDGIDAVESRVREICNDSVKPALDADILKLELEGPWRPARTGAARRCRTQLVRAQEPGWVLPQDRQLQARDGSGRPCAAVSGAQSEPAHPFRRVRRARHRAVRPALLVDATLPVRRRCR